MTIQQLKYALMVAEKASLNEAARQLYISQPSLSFAIKALEDEIRVTIFERTKKGMKVTKEGREFLRKAKEVVQRFEALDGHFSEGIEEKLSFAVSSQHYTFVSEAFAEFTGRHADEGYEFALYESKTLEVLEDVKNLRSEVGVIHMNGYNRTVISRILNEGNMAFSELFVTFPYILVGAGNPLAEKECVGVADLLEYPCVSFVQEDHAPDWFSEEVLSILERRKSIRISDKGTLANLLSTTDAYVVSTGIYTPTGGIRKTAAIPLDTGKADSTETADSAVHVGLIRRKNIVESLLCAEFCDILESVVANGAPKGHEKRYF